MGRHCDGGRRAVCLRLTPLEDRTLPTSGISASLSGGILRITDRLAADTLVIHQTPSGVTVTATDTNQAYAAVTQVMADVQNTDIVTNDVSGLNGTSARSVYLSRRDPTGATFVSSGNLAAGVTSSPTATTTAPPPPPTGSTTSASGVTATLSNGVLRIVDRLAADTLVVHQTSSGVTVTATGTNLTFTAVTQMTLDVQNTDTVTNDVSGLNGASPRSVYLSRRDPTGSTFISSGNLAAGGTSGPGVTTTPPVTPPPSNPTPPPANTTDWFDLALNDAGLRSLTRTVTGDGTIDRQDMLALFNQVEKDGTVSANEIHDLKELENPDWTAGGALPTQTALFNMPDSVRGLLSDVVDGDPANATYQGAALGNLQVGSTATQLQKLVNKWFLGLDHPTASGTYKTVSGTLFVNGPADTDVKQGDLSDCYFLAALGAVAQDSPAAITSMFTDNGDGTYAVRFFNAGVAKYVTVDRMLPTDSSGNLIYDGVGSSATNSGNELWVALAEKAYAQINQSGWLDRTAGSSYSSIEEGFSDDALMEITGGTATWTQIVSSSAAQLQAAVAAGKPTILNSRPSPGNGVIADHTYPVVGYNPTTQQFNLSNPQGGFIQLTWAQITQSFSGFWQLQ